LEASESVAQASEGVAGLAAQAGEGAFEAAEAAGPRGVNGVGQGEGEEAAGGSVQAQAVLALDLGRVVEELAVDVNEEAGDVGVAPVAFEPGAPLAADVERLVGMGGEVADGLLGVLQADV